MSLRCGFIGFGKMAEALYRGIEENELLFKDNIAFVELNEERQAYIADQYGLHLTSLEDLVRDSDILIFCVKPQSISSVLDEISFNDDKSPLCISILAGTPISLFTEKLGTQTPVVRVMPNTPALFGQGMSVLCVNDKVNDEQKEFCETLFSGVGKSVTLEDERFMDTVTGLSGSGPAFFYRIAQNMAKEGENSGLSFEKSLALIIQTMRGSAEMLEKSGLSPHELIEQVASPGGTTESGLVVFDKTNLDEDIQSVIRAAIEKSRDLGKP